MIFTSLSSAVEEIFAAKAFLLTNVRMRAILGQDQMPLEPDFISYDLHEVRVRAPGLKDWRVQDHCAAVSRIYAIFEQYCETILAEWIEFRVRGCRLIDLPEKMAAAYPEGVLTVLAAIKHVRYSHLSEIVIIREYNKALSNSDEFKIAPECLTHHRNNLRLPDVIELFERCGIANCDSWLSSHPSLADHFQIQKKINEQTASKLLNFVKYRNDAAHGSVEIDQILGQNEIEDYCDFMIALMTALDELVNSHAIEWLDGNGSAKKIGSISETLSNNIVIVHIEGVTIRLGDPIYLKTAKSCLMRRIESIRVDDADFEELVLANAREVGLKLNAPALKKANIFSLGT